MTHGSWGPALWLALALPFAAQAGPVNVNTADAKTIAAELNGIGLAKAQAIVAHRDKHGPFRSLDDLARVRGIGARTLEKNRDSIRLDARAIAPRPGPAAAPRQGPAAAPRPVPATAPRTAAPQPRATSQGGR